MKILYFSVEGINSTVFKSQVYDLVSRMNDLDIQIYILQKIPFRLTLKNIKYLFNSLIKINFFIKKLDYDIEAKKLSSYIVSPTIIHCRNLIAAYIALLASKNNNNIKILYDVRGAVEEEKKYFNDNIRYQEFKKINAILFNSKINFSFISTELKQYYLSIYNNIDENNVILANSAFNDIIFKHNNTQKLNTEITGIYIGGNQEYQNINSMIQVLHDKFDRLIIVTSKKLTSKTTSNKLLYFHDLSSEEIVHLVEKYNCDYGVIYRNNEIFNLVATPTKITEYFGMGLKVLAINNASAYTNAIRKNDFLGKIIPVNEVGSLKLEKISLSDRQNISQYAIENFSQKNNIKKYKEFYEKNFL